MNIDTKYVAINQDGIDWSKWRLNPVVLDATGAVIGRGSNPKRTGDGWECEIEFAPGASVGKLSIEFVSREQRDGKHERVEVLALRCEP